MIIVALLMGFGFTCAIVGMFESIFPMIWAGITILFLAVVACVLITLREGHNY